ncbi:cyclin-L1-like [Argopecten irradians]|uniref:cyclin-L1-like n=1 Tax=Argopecten irradians TaxID=31199 RepID=UPI00371A3329
MRRVYVEVAMATGQVIFQRFYYSKSFVKHNMEIIVMACIYLASKIEECPRRMRDVINVIHHIKQVRNQKTIHPLPLDQNYINLKKQVNNAERRVLKELGFSVHAKNPHKVIVMFLQVLECEKDQKLVQCAWNYMNDSFRTDVFVRFHPEVIACACIYLAARQLQIPLPSSPPWYYLFSVEDEDVYDICLTILRLYARPRPNYDKLEAKVNDAKKIQIEAKMKAKGVSSENGTPNHPSRTNSPKNISPNPALLPSIKRLKAEEDRDSERGHCKKNHSSKKKRSHSPNDRSRSRSRSRQRSSRSRSSRSLSRSPSMKRRKNRSSPHRYKKDRYPSPDRYISKEHKHSRKRKKHSRSKSRSPSLNKSPDRYKTSHKKYKHERDRYHSPDRHHKRHRNGHRSPSPRDRYDKYRR